LENLWKHGIWNRTLHGNILNISPSQMARHHFHSGHLVVSISESHPDWYLIAFGKPVCHREVASREFDVHSRWKTKTKP
jgi:hypothetical protein